MAKRGDVLFHSRPLSCFTCHGGVFFSSAMGSGERHGVPEFHNTLTNDQRADVIAFLESLTDEPLLRDPRFATPWR